MGAKEVRAGKAYVELGAKDAALLAGLRRVRAKLKAFGTVVASAGVRMFAAGAAVSGGLFAAGKGFADYAGRINDASARTGVGAEQLQALGYAAGQTGASMDDLEAGLRKMQRTVDDAAGGSKEAAQSLGRLGLSAAQLKGLSPDKQFAKIADALSRVRDPSTRAALAMEVLGKSGTSLLPMVAGGARGLEKMTARARELGLVLSADDVEAGDAFGDTLDELQAQLKMVAVQGGAAVAQVLMPFAGQVLHGVASVIKWVRENRRLVGTVFSVAAGVAAAGAALVGLGIAVKLAAAGVGVFAIVLKAAALTLGFLLNPVTLTIAALAALGAAIVYFSGYGGQALNWLAGKFNVLKGDAEQAFGGIADALAAGDIKLAAKVLWAYLQLEWARGVGAIKGIWTRLKTAVVSKWYDAVGAISAGTLHAVNFFTQAWSVALAGWQRMVNTVSDFVFDNFMNNLDEVRKTEEAFINKQEQRFKDSGGAHGFSPDQARQRRAMLQGAPDTNLRQQRQQRDAAEQQKLQEELARAQREHDAAIANLKQMQADDQAALTEESEKELAAQEAKVKAAEAELRALRQKAEAQKKAAAGDPESRGDPRNYTEPDLGELRKMLVRGTFNGAAVGLLDGGGGAAAERQTAKNTAETVKATLRAAATLEKMYRDMTSGRGSGGLSFQ